MYGSLNWSPIRVLLASLLMKKNWHSEYKFHILLDFLFFKFTRISPITIVLMWQHHRKFTNNNKTKNNQGNRKLRPGEVLEDKKVCHIVQFRKYLDGWMHKSSLNSLLTHKNISTESIISFLFLTLSLTNTRTLWKSET